MHIAYRSMAHTKKQYDATLLQNWGAICDTSSWIHVSGVCGEGGLTLRQQTHLYRGHLRYILLYLTTRTDVILKSSLFLVVELRYLFRENGVVSSSKVEKSKTDGNFNSTVTKS
jgi:hypothetical protein